MKKTTKRFAIFFLAVGISGTAIGQGVMIYPAKGQSHQQMESDKFQCYGWAKNNSGFDPMQSSVPAAAQPSAPRGGLLRGGARGAAMGAAIGAIAGDAGKGAAIGAVSGGMLGKMKQRDTQHQNQQTQQNYNSASRGNYDRAYAVCLEGKGYAVK